MKEVMMMRKILQELYDGNIRPSEKRFTEDSAFAQYMDIVVQNEALLTGHLRDEERKRLSAWSDAQADINAITAREYFIDGFRLGAHFMLAVMEEEDGCFLNIP